jgi:hypothetical protein
MIIKNFKMLKGKELVASVVYNELGEKEQSKEPGTPWVGGH